MDAESGTLERERAAWILIYFCISGAFWIVGALVDGSLRYAFWLSALAVDYGVPLVLFRIPRMRRMVAGNWTVGTELFAE